MADLLDELRDANPVIDCDPLAIEAIWPLLDAHGATLPEPWARRSRAQWQPPAAIASALAIGVLLVSIITGRAGTSVVARAYAAMDSSGVVIHWVSTSRATGPSGLSVRHEEAWISGPDAHTIISGANPGPSGRHGRRLSFEAAFNGSVLQRYDAITNVMSTARLVGSGTGPGLPQDPLQTFRDFYRRGRVKGEGTRVIAGRRVNMLVVYADGGERRPMLTFFVDTVTGAPVEFISYTYSSESRLLGTVTTVFQTYARLPLTSATRTLLALLPHPAAAQTPTTNRQRGGAPRRASP
jgi:hypothetical protein